jgi:hypothetical protein
MSFRPRRALVGLVAAAAALVALPAAASAAITPALILSESGTTAGSNPTVGFDAKFTSTTGDTPKDVTFALPPGLLANENINGGACLVSKAPSSACQVGSGTVTSGTTGDSVTVDLVAPPKAGDVAGLALVSGTTPLATAEVTLTPTGLDVVFSALTPGVVEMNVSLTNLRLPTSCPSPSANTRLTADSQQSTTPVSTTAPLEVTGCSSLPYAPKLTPSVTKDKIGNGATLVFGVTQAPDEAATRSIMLNLPKGLAPNALADAACLTGTGPGCTVGTATATSPLLPSVALAKGTVTLGGTLAAPTLKIAFPVPFAITFTGAVSLTSGSVAFANLPDVPLTSLTQTIAGPNGQKAFTTDCKPASLTGTFSGQNGKAEGVNTPVTFAGCASKPTGSGSTSGLAEGRPNLKFTVTHGKGGANIATVAIGVPAGLKFSHSAIVSHKTCTTKGKKRKCTTTTVIKGLGVSGATAKSVAIKGGRLVVTLQKAAGRVRITTAGPLVSETKALQRKVKKHKVTSLKFALKIIDAEKAATTLSLALQAH